MYTRALNLCPCVLLSSNDELNIFVCLFVPLFQFFSRVRSSERDGRIAAALVRARPGALEQHCRPRQGRPPLHALLRAGEHHVANGHAVRGRRGIAQGRAGADPGRRLRVRKPETAHVRDGEPLVPHPGRGRGGTVLALICFFSLSTEEDKRARRAGGKLVISTPPAAGTNEGRRKSCAWSLAVRALMERGARTNARGYLVLDFDWTGDRSREFSVCGLNFLSKGGVWIRLFGCFELFDRRSTR